MKTAFRFQITFCCLVLLACFSPAARGKGFNLSAIERDGYAVVPIKEPTPNVLLIHAKIGGHPVRLVLDTGALFDGIMLDSDFSRVLHLPGAPIGQNLHGVVGELSGARKATADLVELENVQLRNVPVVFATLQIFRQRSDEGMSLTANPRHAFEQADGFIGAGFLHRASAILDLVNLRLYVRPPGVGRMVDLGNAMKTFKMAEAPLLSTSTGGCVVEVTVDDATSHLLVDTGAGLTEVDPRYAGRFKEANFKAHVMMSDISGTEREVNRVTPRSFRVGGNAATPPVVMVTENNFYTASHGALAGLLGLDFLGQHNSILDFGRSRLYFAPLL